MSFLLLPADQVLGEIPEVVKTGVWVGDCFIFTSSLNRLNYYVGGEIITIAHLDRYDEWIHLGLFIKHGSSTKQMCLSTLPSSALQPCFWHAG